MKRIFTALAIIAASLFGFARFVEAWHLDSACVNNVWVVSNGENEAASTNIGPIPARGSKNVPEGTNTVTVTWPSDQGPQTYTRPAGCHAPTTTTHPPTTTVRATTTTVAATSPSTSPPATTPPTSPPTTPAPTTPAPTVVTQPSESSTTVAATSPPVTARPSSTPAIRRQSATSAPSVNVLPTTGTRETTALIAFALVSLGGLLVVWAVRRPT